MDGLPESGFLNHQVIVLDSLCSELRRERGTRSDFLRPSLAFFLSVDDGYRLKVRMVLERWIQFFAHPIELSVLSDWINRVMDT